ncbi:TPA: PAS domain-containing protein [Methanosarcinaceae archaeon]|nr:PAS domain-containing protein [Methanosarcinaceae archaeon]
MFSINSGAAKADVDEFSWMKQVISTSPEPIFRVGKDGEVLYANEAGAPLLEVWGIRTGDQLPENVACFVRKVLREREPRNLVVKGGEKEYSLMFKPLDEEFVHIHGPNLSSRKPDEEKPRLQEHQQQVLSRLGELSLSSAGHQTLLDKTAAMVDSVLEVESCEILNFPQTLYPPTTAQPPAEHEFVGGISIPFKIQGASPRVITLYSRKQREFTPEDVHFLVAVLTLLTKILEYGKLDRKLRNRILFLETLLEIIPSPIFFRDRNGVSGGSNELFSRHVADFSRGTIQGYSLPELEEALQKELPEFYNKNAGTISGEEPEHLGVMVDISELRENREALRVALEVQKVLWTVINNSPAVVFVWRNEENWPSEFVSENVSQFGYSVEDFTSGRVLYGNIIHREDFGRVCADLDRCVEEGYESFKMEYRIFTKEGELRWVDERTFIQRDEEGKATLFQGVVIDITERKVAEEALAKAEQLRKKEINHRIKNNLQIVSSLLDLQAEKFSDEKVVEAFRESENRVVSMSLIHEELYESGDLDSLDFSSYIRKLIADLFRSYNVGSSEVRLHLDVDRVVLGVDTVIALGIIINELFTNSLKYAFQAGTRGEIHIALLREGSGGDEKPGKTRVSANFQNSSGIYDRFMLVFSDNGKGFPEGIDFRNPEILGLQLVNALVDQIEGTIEMEKEAGTKFIIRFRDELQGRNRRLISEV